MTATFDFSEHFSTTLAKDIAGMLLGRCDGVGTHRVIYEHATDPSLIIKIEGEAGSFRNIYEHQVWEHVKETKWAKWFAPVVSISPAGTTLIMRKCEVARLEDMPRQVPAFMTDLKFENWGWYTPTKGERRLVCLDYGNHLMLEHGLTNRMRTVRDWRIK